jgi:predicted amidohydrolase
MKLTVALAQIDAKVGDLVRNCDHHLQMIERAREQGAGLIVFPELSLTGYTVRDLVWDLALDPERDPRLETLRRASSKISVVAGLVEAGEDHGIYNSAVLFEDGNVRHVHRKIYPPTYGMFEEGRYFSPGSSIHAVDTRHGRMGMAICEDFWHLSVPYLLAMDGAEILLSLTASPTRIGSAGDRMENAAVNHEHHRVYARLLSSAVIFVNRVGFEDGVSFWGGSCLIDPFGRITAQAPYFTEELLIGSIDSNETSRARRFSRHVLDERPELLQENLRHVLQRRFRRDDDPAAEAD